MLNAPKFRLNQHISKYIHNKVNNEYANKRVLTSYFLKILPWTDTPLIMVPVGAFIRSRHSITHLLLSECSGFDRFYKQKTEALVELTIHIFTNLLLGYIQCYIQYKHIEGRLLIVCMLCP